jgi:serine/threonine protein kinase
MSSKKRQEFLGKGQYGCVLSPPTKCDGNNDKLSDNWVGKLFTYPRYGIEEYDINRYVVDIIDPGSKFTNKLELKCNVGKSKSFESPVKNCPINPDTIQLIYRDKGTSLDKVFGTTTNISENQLFTKVHDMLNIVEGLVSMDKHAVLHCDIKPANILESSENTILIDFGLARKYEEIYFEKNLFILVHKYIYYPPEFTLRAILYNKYQHRAPDISKSDYVDIVKCVVSICSKNYMNSGIHLIGLDTRQLENEIKRGTESLLNVISDKSEKLKRKKTILSQHDINEIFVKYANRIDVFSFGMVLLGLLNTRKNFIINEKQQDTTLSMKMKKILHGCISMNVNDRTIPSKLLTEYRDFLQQCTQ